MGFATTLGKRVAMRPAHESEGTMSADPTSRTIERTPCDASWLVAAAVVACVCIGQRAEAHAQTTPTGIVVVQAPPQQYAPVVQYQQPYAQPVYSEPPRRRGGPNLGLIISGAVLLGVGWIGDFLVSLPAGDDPFHSGAEPEWSSFRYTSFIPIAGPWVQLAVKPTEFDNDYWGMWLIIDGLMQAAGITMLVAGIATSSGDDGATADAGGVQLMFVPSVGPDRASLTLAGRF
jgi:hypothetical protein